MPEMYATTSYSDSAPVEDSEVNSSGGSRSFGPIEVLIQLVRRKRLIALVTAVAMLIGLFIGLTSPVMYTATVKITTPQQRSSAADLINQFAGSDAGSLAALAMGGDLGLSDPNAIYLGLLQSRPVADAIIHRFSLDREYRTKNMEDSRKALAAQTVVAAEKAVFINVSVTDKDKNRAADVANAYIDELRILMKSLAVTEASQRRIFYEERLAQSKEALLEAEAAFQQVQQKKGVIQPDDQAKYIFDGIAELRVQIAAKEVEVQALRSYSTEKNPEVQLAEHELSSLQAEQAQLEQKSHSSGFGDLGLADVPGVGLEYLRAQHEVVYKQALYDMLMKQYEAARLDEAKDAAIIQIVEPAIAPDRKSGPHRAKLLLFFTIMGFFAGGLLAMLLWRLELMQSDPEFAKQLQPLNDTAIGRFCTGSARTSQERE